MSFFYYIFYFFFFFFFFQAEDGIRDIGVTGVQTCALPILICCFLVMVAKKLSVRGLHAFLTTQMTCRLCVFMRLSHFPREKFQQGEPRSEERRVGKECRYQMLSDHEKKKIDKKHKGEYE